MPRRWRRSIALVVTTVVAYAVVVFLAMPALPLWVTGHALFNAVALLFAVVAAKWLVVDGGFHDYEFDPFGLKKGSRSDDATPRRTA